MRLREDRIAAPPVMPTSPATPTTFQRLVDICMIARIELPLKAAQTGDQRKFSHYRRAG
jgi:hypothetical protein